MMGIFGWSYPPGADHDANAPYNQDDPPCEVCGKFLDGDDGSGECCDCPECPKCGRTGESECYRLCGLKTMHDSVQSFCDHIGISPVSSAMRAIDRHNVEHVWLVVSGESVYYHSDKELTWLDRNPHVRIRRVGVGGIAWDVADWEYSEEVEAGDGWTHLDAVRQNFEDALAEHTAEREDE